MPTIQQLVRKGRTKITKKSKSASIIEMSKNELKQELRIEENFTL